MVATASRLDRLKPALDLVPITLSVTVTTKVVFEQVRDLLVASMSPDPVGGDVFDESMLPELRRLVIVGFTSGRAVTARTNHVLIKGASVVGIRAGEFARRHPAEGNAIRIWAWASEGRSTRISHRFVLKRRQTRCA